MVTMCVCVLPMDLDCSGAFGQAVLVEDEQGSKLVCNLNGDKTEEIRRNIMKYLRAAAPAADPGQKKRFVCLRDDTKTKEFAQVRSSFAVTRRCLLLPFASDIF